MDDGPRLAGQKKEHMRGLILIADDQLAGIVASPSAALGHTLQSFIRELAQYVQALQRRLPFMRKQMAASVS
jgi:hypothetical protein